MDNNPLMNLIEQNKIPYNDLPWSAEMNDYIRRVGNQARRRHSRMKTGLKCKRIDAKARLELTDYCHYTGIRFVDAEQKWVNPNDPRKRTLDHITPLSICFLQGWSEDQANDVSNLCYVLRCMNNLRQSTSLESFMDVALYYRKHLLESGYEGLDNSPLTCYNK